jgi:radical SAM/Cys-rich protein
MKKTKFHEKVMSVQPEPLQALEIKSLQVNVGPQCNMACKHCHLAAGPGRTGGMDRGTADAVLQALAENPIDTLDITGGAPELSPLFRPLVREARKLRRRVIVRTNLTIFFEEGMDSLPDFYREHDVELVASLPFYSEDSVDRVRGTGTFQKSIAALRKLNALGYGNGVPGKVLDLVYNPPGVFLSSAQDTLEQEYKKELKRRFNVSFNRLYTFTNMPIGRFKDFLLRTGNLEKYQEKLACSFNPRTLDGVMCRHLISVGQDGALYDCDFNQALGLPVDSGGPANVKDFDLAALSRRKIAVDDHCFGCTAGQGST